MIYQPASSPKRFHCCSRKHAGHKRGCFLLEQTLHFAVLASKKNVLLSPLPWWFKYMHLSSISLMKSGSGSSRADGGTFWHETNRQRAGRAVRRAAWLSSIRHSGTASNRAAHWFTKDIWLSIFFPALGPGKQLFFQMKAFRAVGTSFPPGLLWATSWAPALSLSALASKTSLWDWPTELLGAWRRLAHLLVLRPPPPAPGTLGSFQLTDLHDVLCKIPVLRIIQFHKPVYTLVDPVDK